MAAAAFLSVTLVPALMVVFIRGRIIPEQPEPDQSRLLICALPSDDPRAFSGRKTLTILLAHRRCSASQPLARA